MAHVEILHHRYAVALFEIAKSKQKEEDIMTHLAFLSNFIKDNREITRFLYNPEADDREKVRLLLEIAKRRDFCDEFIDFLKLLVRKGRLRLIHGIFLRYRDFYDMHKNRIVAFLKSAHELEEAQMKRLRDVLQRRCGKDVVIKHSVEPSLIGGFLLQLGDKVYDTSLRTRLLKLKEVMAG